MLIAAELPDGSGLELCRQVRNNPVLARTPVVMLIAAERAEGGAEGLEAGADDCVTEPFNPRELVARVQAVLRRLKRPQAGPVGEPTDIVIDRAAMKLSVRGTHVATTTLEFRLVDYLAQHRGHVFTRDVLLDAVWGEMQFVTPRSVDACIRRVRDKIEPDRGSPTYLKTIRGVGYRFDGVAVWPSSNQICNCVACLGTSESPRTPHSASWKRKQAVSQSLTAPQTSWRKGASEPRLRSVGEDA